MILTESENIFEIKIKLEVKVKMIGENNALLLTFNQ